MTETQKFIITDDAQKFLDTDKKLYDTFINNHYLYGDFDFIDCLNLMTLGYNATLGVTQPKDPITQQAQLLLTIDSNGVKKEYTIIRQNCPDKDCDDVVPCLPYVTTTDGESVITYSFEITKDNELQIRDAIINIKNIAVKFSNPDTIAADVINATGNQNPDTLVK